MTLDIYTFKYIYLVPMKTIRIAVLPLFLLPCSLRAGAEREVQRHTHEVVVHSPQIEDRTVPEAAPRASVVAEAAIPPSEQPPSTIQHHQVKATTKHHAKPLRKAWAQAGTIILIVSAALFFLGLIFLLIGAVSFYGYGLLLLGGIFMIISSIGLTVGLIVGAVG